MTTTSISTEDLIQKFKEATFDRNIKIIESLLDGNGAFEIQDKDLETIKVKKEEFINWYEQKLSQTTIKECVFDQCIGCSFGNHILIFDDGAFPFKPKDSSERSKSALKLMSKDGKINEIAFCFAFLKTENKYVFQIRGKIINDFMQNEGLSYKQSLMQFMNNPGNEHLKYSPSELKEIESEEDWYC